MPSLSAVCALMLALLVLHLCCTPTAAQCTTEPTAPASGICTACSPGSCQKCTKRCYTTTGTQVSAAPYPVKTLCLWQCPVTSPLTPYSDIKYKNKTCLSTGTWSSASPCQILKCAEPTAPTSIDTTYTKVCTNSSGAAVTAPYPVGADCKWKCLWKDSTASCAQKYPVKTCLDNTFWSNPSTTCPTKTTCL